MCLAGWWAGGGEVNETLLRGLAHSGCPSVTGSGEGKRADPGAGAGGGRPGRQAGPSPVRVHLRESVGGVALEGKSRGRQESARGGGASARPRLRTPRATTHRFRPSAGNWDGAKGQCPVMTPTNAAPVCLSG